MPTTRAGCARRRNILERTALSRRPQHPCEATPLTRNLGSLEEHGSAPKPERTSRERPSESTAFTRTLGSLEEHGSAPKPERTSRVVLPKAGLSPAGSALSKSTARLRSASLRSESTRRRGLSKNCICEPKTSSLEKPKPPAPTAALARRLPRKLARRLPRKLARRLLRRLP